VGRLKQIKIGVDTLTEARLSVRAEEAGASVSEYVRRLIVRDLSGVTDEGAAPAVSPAAASDPAVSQLLELSLVTGMLVRAQLARAVGEDEARKLQVRAQEKAAEQVRLLVPAADSLT
jgi:hypothetical protein